MKTAGQNQKPQASDDRHRSGPFRNVEVDDEQTKKGIAPCSVAMVVGMAGLDVMGGWAKCHS